MTLHLFTCLHAAERGFSSTSTQQLAEEKETVWAVWQSLYQSLKSVRTLYALQPSWVECVDYSCNTALSCSLYSRLRKTCLHKLYV